MGQREIFDAALALADPAARAAYLEQACAGDPALREQVNGLLAMHGQVGSFLEAPAAALVASATARPAAEGPGAVVGPYKLLEQIGEGGFGIVFMAEQLHPVRRRVAVKVLKPGMDTRQVVARFEAERQALALMDHPHIAKVLDAGTTPAGRPYFVMELVRGVPITEYCDQSQLTPRERLALFLPVCQAVQHAHHKAIIHRDLKPSNVLVTLHDGVPVPKVIDFGVAKAVGQQLTEKTLFTNFAQLIGTPLYMSPEQAELSGLDVDTRSDIYSLGVLLYELLTGTTPFDRERFRTVGYDEMRRIIREEEPPRPSARLSTLGQGATVVGSRRKSDAKRLSQLFRGELDWIVMKCLEKDRGRRYETANGLARDVERYLRDEPVQACPPSAAYRLRKFARRNKRALTTAALLGLMLLAVAGTLGWALRDRAERLAARERDVTQALEEVVSACQRDKLPEAKAALKHAEGLLGGGNEELRGRVYRWRDDVTMITRLQDIRLEKVKLKDERLDFLRADPAYGAAFRDYGLDLEALDPDEAGARIRASSIKDHLVAALDDWVLSKPRAKAAGWERLLAVARRADDDSWRNRFREALQRGDKKAMEDLARSPDILRQPPATVGLAAGMLAYAGKRPLAIQVLQQAQQRHPDDFWTNFDLARLMHRSGQAGEAVGFYRVAVALRPDSAGAHCNLGVALLARRKHAEAEAACREAIRLQADFAMAHNNLGVVLEDKGDPEGALAAYRKAIALRPQAALPHANLGKILMNHQGKYAEAEAELREALHIEPKFALPYHYLGNLLHNQKDFEGAVAAYRKAIHLSPKHPGVHKNLGNALMAQHKPAEAAAAFRQAIYLQPEDGDAHWSLGLALLGQNQWAESAAAFREAIRLLPKEAGAHMNLGVALRRQGRHAEAEDEYREAIRLAPTSAPAHTNLGLALAAQGKQDAAEAAFREAIRLDPGYAQGHGGLAELLAQQGKHTQAEDEFRVALRLQPNNADTHYNLGVFLYRRGKMSEAEAEYREALRLNPDRLNDYINLGDFLAWLGRGDEALAYFRQALQHKPDFSLARTRLGLGLANQGRLEEAAAAFDEAVRHNPKEVSFYSSQADWQTTHPELRLRDPGQTVALARKAVQLTPQAHSAPAWLTLGRAYYQAGDWKECVAALEKSCELQTSPKGGDAGQWSFLAMAHWQLGDKETARQWFDKASQYLEEHGPLDERFQGEAALLLGVPGLARGRAYAERGDWDRAAADYALTFGQGLSRYPDLWFEHACLRVQVGDAAGYRKLCGRMMKRFGKSTNPDEIVYLAHACVLAPGGLDPTAALSLAERRLAMTARPSGHYPWSIHLVALAHYRAGHYPQAVEWATRGLKEDPAFGERVPHWLLLAMAHHRLGHAEEARKWLGTAEQWIAAKDRSRKGGHFTPAGLIWRGWLLTQMVYREAADLLKENR
jgi:tetratricopeptide (TPR) repeat protein/serine/threonine protein kinase